MEKNHAQHCKKQQQAEEVRTQLRVHCVEEKYQDQRWQDSSQAVYQFDENHKKFNKTRTGQKQAYD